jgi:hypothetical protein
MDDDATIKPQVGISIMQAIGSIIALQEYLDSVATCHLTENLWDLRGEKEEN